MTAAHNKTVREALEEVLEEASERPCYFLDGSRDYFDPHEVSAVFYSFNNEREVGREEEEIYNEETTQMEWVAHVVSTLEVLVRVEALSQDDEQTAEHILKRIRRRLNQPKHQERLKAAGLGMVRTIQFIHQNESRDDRMWSVAIMPIMFNLFELERPEDEVVDQIEGVVISSDLEQPGGDLLAPHKQMDEEQVPPPPPEE